MPTKLLTEKTTFRTYLEITFHLDQTRMPLQVPLSPLGVALRRNERVRVRELKFLNMKEIYFPLI
jgi:hypothetical protein